jgi:hypothetical protein
MTGMASRPILGADAPTHRPSPRNRHPEHSLVALWSAFVVVHAVLAVLVLTGQGRYLGDVLTIYQPWAEFARDGAGIVGIQLPWVYPVVALVPIMLPIVFGPSAYGPVWVAMIVILDAAAFVVLTSGRHPRSLLAAWWWLAFLLLLGPVAISRIDSVSVPIVIAALLWLGLRRQLAVVLITVATWVKVWPAALLLALLIALRDRWRILGWAIATSLAIVIVALTYGAGWRVLSFVTAQTSRGVQIEAPVATPWMWATAFHVPGNAIVYDLQLNTFQISGPGSTAAGSLMTPLLAIAVLAVAAIGVRALRHGATPNRMLPPLMMALVCAMIVFDKVGSPQYMTWLAAPVIAGIVWQGSAFRRPALLMLAIAFLTQCIYPYLYDWLLLANPVMLGLLTLRNLGVCVVFVWSVRALWLSARAGDLHIPDLEPTAVWPFRLRAPHPEEADDAGGFLRRAERRKQ